MPSFDSASIANLTVPSRPGPIRLGSTGVMVTYVQNLLNARMPGQALWVDGVFGAKTDGRVRQFQGSKGLAVDGIVGPMTLGRLESGPPPISKRPAGSVETKSKYGGSTKYGGFGSTKGY